MDWELGFSSKRKEKDAEIISFPDASKVNRFEVKIAAILIIEKR